MRFSQTSLLINLLLAAVKATVGIVAGSRALLASALYSVNDVLSAVVVLVSLRVARRPADQGHAYGYGGAEFIAMGFVSLILAGGVVFVLVLSIGTLTDGIEGPPHVSALLVALLTLAINLVLAENGYCAARRLGSPALHTSAEHNHVDAVSSLAVAIGIGAALLGFHAVDSVIAIFETIHVMWLAGTLFGKSSRGLMDVSLPRREKLRIRRLCDQVPGVLKVLELRSRRLGSQSWIDVVFAVPGNLSVDQASQIASRVQTTIISGSSHVAGVHVRFREGRMSERLLQTSSTGGVE